MADKDFNKRVIAFLEGRELAEEQKTKLKEMFPELKESEDIRIREALIRVIRKYAEGYDNLEAGLSVTDSIAWLEKQGEQKPQMIQWNGYNLRDVIVFTGTYHKFKQWFRNFEDYEYYVHTHGDIFKLFNEDGSHYEVPVGAWIVKTPDGYNVASKATFKPKPAEWSDDDESNLDYLIAFCNDYNNGRQPVLTESVARSLSNWLYRIKSGEIALKRREISDEKVEGAIHYACEFIRHRAINMNDTIGSTTYKELVEALNAVKHRCLQQQDQEWSEEDNKLRDSSVAYLCNLRDSFESRKWDKTPVQRCINWLMSIKPQPKQGWSEEDEDKLNRLYHLLRSSADTSQRTREEWAEWLKSLRPQNRWKPTEEQMEALAEYIWEKEPDKSKGKAVISLYNELKKLIYA